MHDPPPTRVTILISGNGTNLQALIDASTTTMPYLNIVRVISNRANAYGLTRAQKASIPTTYHNLIAGKYHASGEKDAAVKQKARESYDADLARMVLEDTPDLVVCAGWMHILAPTFLNPLAEKRVPVINLHPGTFNSSSLNVEICERETALILRQRYRANTMGRELFRGRMMITIKGS